MRKTHTTQSVVAFFYT